MIELVKLIFFEINMIFSNPTNSSTASAIAFWNQKQESKVYSFVPLVAQDYVCIPASQAFVRLLSVCSILTAGICHRMDKSINMHAWLKVNYSELVDIKIIGDGFNWKCETYLYLLAVIWCTMIMIELCFLFAVQCFKFTHLIMNET